MLRESKIQRRNSTNTRRDRKNAEQEERLQRRNSTEAHRDRKYATNETTKGPCQCGRDGTAKHERTAGYPTVHLQCTPNKLSEGNGNVLPPSILLPA